MHTNEILSQIETEIARLQEVKSILTGTTTTKATRGPKKAYVGPTLVAAKKHTMSAEGGLRIAAAQKARWAKVKRAKKAA
jgi:hypothetical protein